MSLSALAIQNAKPKAKLYKLSDGDGLHLGVHRPHGSKLWRFRYLSTWPGKHLSLGTYPEISLAAARARRDDALKLLANGIDPSRPKSSIRLPRRRRPKIPLLLSPKGI